MCVCCHDIHNKSKKFKVDFLIMVLKLSKEFLTFSVFFDAL